MAIIRQKYEGQLDGLIKRFTASWSSLIYFNINNALVSLGEERNHS